MQDSNLKKHRLVGLKKLSPAAGETKKEAQRPVEEILDSVKEGARELTLNVSAICEKEGKKLAYVTFTDGEKKAEGVIPECVIIVNEGFTKEEVEQLQAYMQRELPLLKKTAAGIRLFDAFRK